MKTSFLSLTITATFLLSSVSPVESFAHKQVQSVKKETNPGFASLRTHRQAKGITATWSMTGVDGVVCFTVQRTDGDPTDMYAYWVDVATIACNPSRTFSHTDQEVFPGNIHYRIVANMADGTSVVSEVSSIRIVSRK